MLSSFEAAVQASGRVRGHKTRMLLALLLGLPAVASVVAVFAGNRRLRLTQSVLPPGFDPLTTLQQTMRLVGYRYTTQVHACLSRLWAGGGPTAAGNPAYDTAYDPAGPFSALTLAHGPLLPAWHGGQWESFQIALVLVLPVFVLLSLPVWSSSSRLRVPLTQCALLLLVLLATWPVVWPLFQQQAGLLTPALVAMGCLLFRHHLAASLALVAMLGSVQPTLVTPLAGWLVLWTMLHVRWRFAVPLVTTAVLVLSVAQVVLPV